MYIERALKVAQKKINSFHTVGMRRLQVNESASRYQKELQYLARAI